MTAWNAAVLLYLAIGTYWACSIAAECVDEDTPEQLAVPRWQRGVSHWVSAMVIVLLWGPIAAYDLASSIMAWRNRNG